MFDLTQPKQKKESDIKFNFTPPPSPFLSAPLPGPRINSLPQLSPNPIQRPLVPVQQPQPSTWDQVKAFDLKGLAGQLGLGLAHGLSQTGTARQDANMANLLTRNTLPGMAEIGNQQLASQQANQDYLKANPVNSFPAMLGEQIPQIPLWVAGEGGVKAVGGALTKLSPKLLSLSEKAGSKLPSIVKGGLTDAATYGTVVAPVDAYNKTYNTPNGNSFPQNLAEAEKQLPGVLVGGTLARGAFKGIGEGTNLAKDIFTDGGPIKQTLALRKLNLDVPEIKGNPLEDVQNAYKNPITARDAQAQELNKLFTTPTQEPASWTTSFDASPKIMTPAERLQKQRDFQLAVDAEPKSYKLTTVGQRVKDFQQQELERVFNDPNSNLGKTGPTLAQQGMTDAELLAQRASTYGRPLENYKVKERVTPEQKTLSAKQTQLEDAFYSHPLVDVPTTTTTLQQNLDNSFGIGKQSEPYQGLDVLGKVPAKYGVKNDVTKSIAEVEARMAEIEQGATKMSNQVNSQTKIDSLVKQVRDAGGIAPSKTGAFASEYKDNIPATFKNKNGRPLDEIADQMGMSARELIDAIGQNPKANPKTTGDMFSMLDNDAEYKALTQTLDNLRGQLPGKKGLPGREAAIPPTTGQSMNYKVGDEAVVSLDNPDRPNQPFNAENGTITKIENGIVYTRHYGQKPGEREMSFITKEIPIKEFEKGLRNHDSVMAESYMGSNPPQFSDITKGEISPTSQSLTKSDIKLKPRELTPKPEPLPIQPQRTTLSGTLPVDTQPSMLRPPLRPRESALPQQRIEPESVRPINDVPPSPTFRRQGPPTLPSLRPREVAKPVDEIKAPLGLTKPERLTWTNKDVPLAGPAPIRSITQENVGGLRPPTPINREPIKPAEQPSLDQLNVANPVNQVRTGDSSLQGGIPGAKEFVDQDVVPTAKNVVHGIRDTFDRVRSLIAPRSTVGETPLNSVMRLKGEREQQLFTMEKRMNSIKEAFTKMPETEHIDFLDRYKQGVPQKSPELQAIADGYKKLDDATYQELLKYKPSLAFKENHFRIFWKVIPGQPESKGFTALFKRPLQGTKGFMKRSTLQDVSEGIERGGVPITTNPQRLFELGQADSLKFITAQKMFGELKDIGSIKFVRNVKDIPEGFVRLDDRMAKVYFPAPTIEEGLQGKIAPVDRKILSLTSKGKDTGLLEQKKSDLEAPIPHLGNDKSPGIIQAGEYYVEPNVGRILNNYLSKNLIRETELGKGLMWVKNMTTAAELALSPFHAVFESLDAMASKWGIGITRTVNQGIIGPINKGKLPNIGEIGKGLKDISTAWNAPVEYYKVGSSAIKYVSNKEEFLQTAKGQKFITQFPEADNAINQLFVGGGKLAINEDYKIKSIQTMRENWNNKNWIGAGIRAIPAFNETIMKPLFEKYIPNLKIGLFLKEFGQQMEQHNDAILSGEITQEKIARQTWDRVENKLGEMNFDNLFWNNTFKASMQLAFRSVTWKLGSIRGFGGSLGGQVRELGSLRHGKIPSIDPGLAWVMGVGVTTATMASIIQHATTGEMPSEPMDYMFPKVGGEDKDGNPNRLSIPTYLKDAMHLVKNPLTYASNSMSGFISKTVDVMQNKDYYGNYVYNPDDPLWKKFTTSIGYEIPKPFSVTQYQNMVESNGSAAEKTLGSLGFTKAPRDYTVSRFQMEVSNAFGEQVPNKSLTTEEQKIAKDKSALKHNIFYGKTTDSEAKSLALSSGLSTKSSVNTFIKNAHLPPTEVMWKSLSDSARARIIKYATPEEVQRLQKAGILERKKAK